MGTWGQGGQLLNGYMGTGVQLLTVGTWGQGGPAAYSGYMGARGLAAYSGYMGAGGPVAYSGYMGAGEPVGTWGQGGVGTWGRGSSCLQLVHVGRGSSCLQWTHGVGVPVTYSGYMTAGSPAAYMYKGEGVQLLTVGTWGRGSSCL